MNGLCKADAVLAVFVRNMRSPHLQEEGTVAQARASLATVEPDLPE